MRSLSFTQVFVVAALTVQLLSMDAEGSEPFPIATNSAVVEFNAGIASDGTNFLVALLSGTNLNTHLVSSNGTSIGAPLTVGTNPGFPPAVAITSGLTNYLVVWSDRSLTSGVTMFGQFVSRTGGKIGAAFNLLQDRGAHGFQGVRALASDGTNFLLVWLDQQARTFHGQRIGQDGTLLGQDFLVSGQANNGDSAAAVFGKTHYLVVWQGKDGFLADDHKTYGALVPPAGSAGAPFQISQTASTNHNPLGVAFDGTNYLVAWNWSHEPGGLVVTNWNIHGRIVSATGTFPGNEVVLVENSGSQVFPTLAFDGANYLLAWGDEGPNFTNSQIRFQFVNCSAAAIGPVFTVFTRQGTNAPFLPFNGLAVSGHRFAVAATLATVARNSEGRIIGLPSADVYGAFLTSSAVPPRLSPAGSYDGTHFPLVLTGTRGINYRIQTSTNLAENNWRTLATASPTNGTFAFTDSTATNSTRIYRAVTE